IAVFVPLSFLPGQAGGLFREFGFVLAMAVFLSSIVALSLCPMLASRMLASGHGAEEHSSRIGGMLAGLYRRCLHACLQAPAVVVLVSILFAGAAGAVFGTIKTELTPSEDRSMAFLRVSAPQGVSLDYFTNQMRRIEELLTPLRRSGEVRSVFSIAGWGGSKNSGFIVLRLAPWDERERSQQQILDQVVDLVKRVPGVRAFAYQPNSLHIRGAGSGLQFAVAGYDYQRLTETAQKI